MNIWFLVLVTTIILGYLVEFTTSFLSLSALKTQLPEEFRTFFNRDQYSYSQVYVRERTHFSLVSTSLSTLAILLFLFLGGFNTLDLFLRSFKVSSLLTGFLFLSSLALFSFLLHLPFSLYSTFVLESRYGFNRTSLSTFISDIGKSLLLAVILGGPLLLALLWFFENSGPFAWIYSWLFVTGYSVFVQFIAPVCIMPLFNTFTSLPDGPLRRQILDYASEHQFAIEGIYTMDGSKRTTKLNAFLTGFGKYKKIVFYDTLLEKLTNDEIVAVLAHEMGHFRLGHVHKMLACSICQTGFMFYLLSLLLSKLDLLKAFGMENPTIYAAIVFFVLLYTPVNIIQSAIYCWFSRCHEYQADAFAATTTGQARYLISSLKKLTETNLSNLTPHPVQVFCKYTHPPVLQRIVALRDIKKKIQHC